MDDLIRQRDDLKKKLRELDDLAETGTEKILNAIKSQRWYFFENNKYILFDRDTALIWANLDFFPYKKESDYDTYSPDNSFYEVKNLMKRINSQNWGGFSDWEIPWSYTFCEMIDDKTFPFQYGNGWCIKGWNTWCVNGIDGLASKYVYTNNDPEKDIEQGVYVCVLPCIEKFKAKDFYTTPKYLLDIFTKNKLFPIFNDDKINALYRIIFVDK